MSHIHKTLCHFAVMITMGALLLSASGCGARTRVVHNPPTLLKDIAALGGTGEATPRLTEPPVPSPNDKNYAALGGTGEATPLLLESPVPSPNGQLIAFASAAGATNTLDIWVADRSGTNPHVLLGWDSVERNPDWSPDGFRIAFSSNHNANDFNVWAMNSNGTGPIQMTTPTGFHGQPRFAPDGSAIAYIAVDGSGTKQLWLMDPFGNNPRQITSSLFQVSDPSWSPDSKTVVFVGCSGGCNLFTINRDGTGFVQITFGAFDDWDPDWGPTGIAFSSNRAATLALWTVQPDGSALTQVTFPVGVGQFEPRWDRTTNSLLFVQAESTNLNVWVKNPDGTQNPVTTIGLDSIPPITSAQVAPAFNTSGWNNTNVTVALNSVDNPGGSGVKQITITLSGAQTGSVVVPGGTASGTITAEGVTTVTYFGADNAGNIESPKTVTIKIDKTPPVISGMPAPGCSLWPPDGKMVQVATVTAADSLSGLVPASLRITGTSNEPPSAPQISIAPNGSGSYVIQLQVNRLGTGTGRIYRLTGIASDLAGNQTTSTATCTVPHDQGQ